MENFEKYFNEDFELAEALKKFEVGETEEENINAEKAFNLDYVKTLRNSGAIGRYLNYRVRRWAYYKNGYDFMNSASEITGFAVGSKTGKIFILTKENQSKLNTKLDDYFDYEKRFDDKNRQYIHSDAQLDSIFQEWKNTREAKIKELRADAAAGKRRAGSILRRKNKLDISYKNVENMSPEEFEIVANWLAENTTKIYFRVPKIDDDLVKLDTSMLDLKTADDLRAKIIDKFDRLEAEFKNEVPGAKVGKDFSYRLTSAEKDTRYADWWNLGGTITFKTILADAPTEVIALIEKAQKIARKNKHDTKPIEDVKQDNYLDSYYFCLMVLKIFDGDLDFYRKPDIDSGDTGQTPGQVADSDDVFKQDFDNINAFGDKVESLKEGKEDKFTCCICGEECTGYGNNPEPYKHEGRCCDACNLKFVIPARLAELNKPEE